MVAHAPALIPLPRHSSVHGAVFISVGLLFGFDHRGQVEDTDSVLAKLIDEGSVDEILVQRQDERRPQAP